MSEKVLSNMWIYSDEKGAFEKGYAEVWEGISGSRKAREKKGMRRREVQEQFYFRIMELPCAFNVGKKERQKRRGENGPLALKDFVRDYQKKKKKIKPMQKERLHFLQRKDKRSEGTLPCGFYMSTYLLF